MEKIVFLEESCLGILFLFFEWIDWNFIIEVMWEGEVLKEYGIRNNFRFFYEDGVG